MTDFLLIALIVLFIIQVITFIKLVTIMRQMNLPQNNNVIKSNSCQYCKYRMSFVQLSDEKEQDNFYYKCKMHDIDISLSDSCEQFHRDYRQV